MPQFRKKPVVVEAVLWTGKRLEPGATPWITEALNKGTPDRPGAIMRIGETVHTGTLEGVMIAQPGDYIIQGVKGELYPCKPDIFAATYDPAD
ncbi:hypothetical protein [Rhizobium mesoamericanum]|uniref:Uncharacterized 10.3 kDa protein in GP2-GP6 intergenic region n=1 Tax=Rhizobium mesoamericanum STM3625 TaxID=1211777 RepID=K0PKX6_9HYPH|nr:hypothetical protein [Rhizobium mesoamericanum]CCM77106.1 Uncharacterized 10.3 kDa protein in GP2-GP6 intergenic region [Rhizobium mesoamericanum STM3625]